MKQLFISVLLFLLLFGNNLFAQDTSKINLDLLRAPSSPGANLLGFAVSEIEKPSDVSAFMATLQTASSGFTKLPSNYAIDIAPFWLGRRSRGFEINSLNKKDFKTVFRQTFVISAAVRNADSADKRFNPQSTYTGLGFKFSIIRGHYDTKTTLALNNIGVMQSIITTSLDDVKKKAYVESKVLQKKMKRLNELEDLFAENVEEVPEYKQLSKEVAEIEKKILDSIVAIDKIKESIGILKRKAAEFKLERTGLFWDIAGGSSFEFINATFNKSRVHNAGIWTNFGINTEKGFTLIGLIRYLYNPEKIYAANNSPLFKRANISTFDAGGRAAFSGPESRFLFSMEAVYRSVLSRSTIDPSWRLALNAEYDIGRNQKLTFVFGRAFDGTVTKDGNLIAALNFLTGFGNKR
ncbi:MAG TPA: hypothetical protein VFV31_03395 [Chitinophagaceae bacterium]|nr:hypothetical protein [Chitinophagaceae bacterium]